MANHAPTGQTGAEHATTTHAEVPGAPEHHEAANFAGLEAPWFIALAMVVVIGIMLWVRVPKLVAGMLDSQIADIRKQIDEAAQLRAEAEALKAEYQAKASAAANEAAGLVDHARQEAADIVARAEEEAAGLVVRRRKMAEDKIAAAERAAVADIRATAVSAATGAAAALIAGNHGAVQDQALVDQAIKAL